MPQGGRLPSVQAEDGADNMQQIVRLLFSVLRHSYWSTLEAIPSNKNSWISTVKGKSKFSNAQDFASFLYHSKHPSIPFYFLRFYI